MIRIVYCLYLIALGGVHSTITIFPEHSNIGITVTSDMIKLSRYSNRAINAPDSHCQAISLRIKDIETAVEESKIFLAEKQMPCFQPKELPFNWPQPNNPQVKAVNIKRDESDVANARRVDVGYNCELVGGQILTSVEFTRTFPNISIKGINTDLAANYFCSSVYDFLWRIVDLGTYIVTRLPVPESTGSSNAISTDT
jgi:hypothetical protein